MNEKETNELKRGAGYLKEKFIIGLSRVTGHELDRAIMKVSSHMLKAPKEKHMQRLLAATYGHYKSDVSGGKSVCDHILTELEKRLHTHNWIVVLKTLVTLHRLMADGSDEINLHIQRRRNLFSVQNIKDLSETLDGSIQNTFIRQYILYLGERISSQEVIGISNRVESAEFSSFLRSLDVNSLIPLFKALLSQLGALVEVEYQEIIVDNFCTLDAYQKLVDDGRILYQLLSNRIIFVLDGFSDFSLHLKNVWLLLCREYVDVGERLRLLFNSILNSSRVFAQPPPQLKHIPETLLKHLEEDVDLSSIQRECVTETLESLGIINDEGRGSPNESPQGNVPPQSIPLLDLAASTKLSEEVKPSTSTTVVIEKDNMFTMDDLFVTAPPAEAKHEFPCPSVDGSTVAPQGDVGLDALGFMSSAATNEVRDSDWTTGAPPPWEIEPSVQHLPPSQNTVLPHAEWAGSPSSVNDGTSVRKEEDVFKNLFVDGQKGWYSKNL